MRAAHKRISFVFRYVKQRSTDQVSETALLCVHKPCQKLLLLTLDHYIVYPKHHEIWRGRIPISSVDCPRNFVGAKLGMRISNDNDVQHPNRFQSIRKISDNCMLKINGLNSKFMEFEICGISNRWQMLTGSSSRPFQMPSTWRDIITCLRFNKAGSALHPVFVTTVSGESLVIPKMLHASFRNVSAA